MRWAAGSRGWIRQKLTAGTVVMLVLLASVGVATALAWRAIAEARQRQAVTAAMLRQYAQLAAWEFSREARKDIEMTFTRALAAQAHPERRMNNGQCDCADATVAQQWFGISADGDLIKQEGVAIPAALIAELRQLFGPDRSETDGMLRLMRFAPTDARIVAVRWEPHLTERGGLIGMVVTPALLEPILSRTYRRVAMLPPQILGARDARSVVHLEVRDPDPAPIFSSQPDAGPYPIDSELLPGTQSGLMVTASMTPAFIAGLGTEQDAGLSMVLVIGLLGLNVVLVTVGIWQVRRERELARLRTDFVAGVSHELRTPLAQIRMFAETLLLDRIRSPYEGRRALEIIGRETRRLEHLVENVLHFHKHDRLATAGAATVVNVSALVRDVVEGFTPLAAARQARIDLRWPAGDVLATVDTDGLRQVILNLLDNAVKFGPPHQLIDVEVTRPDDGHLQIAVSDQGPGIPIEERARIFSAFQRGRVTNGAGGAGIGLAVVAQIVAAHGGTVTIDDRTDQTGRGTRFVVTLPALADAGAEYPPMHRAV